MLIIQAVGSFPIIHGARPENTNGHNVIRARLDEFHHDGSVYQLSFMVGDLRIPAVATACAFDDMRLERDKTAFLTIRSDNINIV